MAQRQGVGLALLSAVVVPLAVVMLLGTAQGQGFRPGPPPLRPPTPPPPPPRVFVPPPQVSNPGFRPPTVKPPVFQPPTPVMPPRVITPPVIPPPVIPPPIIMPPPVIPQAPVFVTVWSCTRCKAELGRGTLKPALDACPNCNARFVNGGGPAFFQQQQPAPPVIPPVVPVPAAGQGNGNLFNPANPFVPANIQQPQAAAGGSDAGTVIAYVVGIVLVILVLAGVTILAIRTATAR